MRNDGVPLPAALSGNTIERLIRLDESLIYLVSGALSWLVDRERFEETGALTVDDTRLALSDMLTIYFSEVPTMTPVGATMIWHMDTPPDRWLICDGSGVLKSEYPELYALFGGKYGVSPDFFGLPDLRGRSPYGADFTIELDDHYGESEHILTASEIPAHSHQVRNRNQIPAYFHSGTAGANPSIADTAGTTNSTVQNTTTNTGGGGAHNNIHPVTGVYFIVYAGK